MPPWAHMHTYVLNHGLEIEYAWKSERGDNAQLRAEYAWQSERGDNVQSEQNMPDRVREVTMPNSEQQAYVVVAFLYSLAEWMRK